MPAQQELTVAPGARVEIRDEKWLVRSIKSVTAEAISLGEGVIYPALHALERNGSLKSRRKAVAGRTRVYYSLTSKGKKRLTKLQDDWRRIQNGISTALESPAHA